MSKTWTCPDCQKVFDSEDAAIKALGAPWKMALHFHLELHLREIHGILVDLSRMVAEADPRTATEAWRKKVSETVARYDVIRKAQEDV